MWSLELISDYRIRIGKHSMCLDRNKGFCDIKMNGNLIISSDKILSLQHAALFLDPSLNTALMT